MEEDKFLDFMLSQLLLKMDCFYYVWDFKVCCASALLFILSVCLLCLRFSLFTGGWSMNDEAAAHYSAIIDNMAIGIKFFQVKQLGSFS